MRIRLVAPFRCHLNVNNPLVSADEEGYCRLWQEIGKAFPAGSSQYPLIDSLEFLHATPIAAGLRYKKLHLDGSLRPPEIVRVRPALGGMATLVGKAIAEAEAALSPAHLKGALVPQPETILFRLYDNTLGLAEMSVKLDPPHGPSGEKRLCDTVEDWANAFMNHLVPSFYRSALFPLVIDVWRLDPKGSYLETPGDYHGFPEVKLKLKGRLKRSHKGVPDYDPSVAGQPLWVSRSLYVDGLALPAREALLAHWVPTAAPDAALGRPTDYVYLGWGHNVFNAPIDSELACDGWEALLLSQYFYTVLESASLGLTRFIGLSLGRLSHRKTQELDRVLQDVVASVNLLVTEFNDTQQNLQGHRQGFFKDLRTRWGMDALVQNVEKKIGLVASQINRLYERSVKTSQMLIGLILCAIGGIALIGFCLSLSQYARTEVASPEKGPAADGVWGLLDLAARYPPDAVIWSGFVILGVLLVIFWLFQRRVK